MHLTVVQRILGLLLMLFSATMLPPLGVSLLYGDGAWYTFLARIAHRFSDFGVFRRRDLSEAT